MKQYVIDQLTPTDFEAVKSYLEENFESSDVGGIYWIPLGQDILTDVQAEHVECQPFCFAVDLEQNSMSSEFLVRTKNTMRCTCMGYATENQRDWIIRFADALFDKLEIIT